MNKERVRQWLFYLVNLSLLLIYILPYSKVFYPEESIANKEQWSNSYLWDDELLIIAYSVYTLVWIMFLSFKHNKFIGLLLGLISMVYFGHSFLAAELAIQDFIPGYGLLAALIHYLSMIIYLYFDLIMSKKMEWETTDRI